MWFTRISYDRSESMVRTSIKFKVDNRIGKFPFQVEMQVGQGRPASTIVKQEWGHLAIALGDIGPDVR